MNGIEKTRLNYGNQIAEAKERIAPLQVKVNEAIERLNPNELENAVEELKKVLRYAATSKVNLERYNWKLERIMVIIRKNGGEASYRKIQNAGVESKYGLRQLVAQLLEAGHIHVSKTNEQGLEWYKIGSAK